MNNPTRGMPTSQRVPEVLFLLFLVEFCALAWSPSDREAWLLENLIALPVAIGLFLARKRLPFSTLSWLLVFSFMALHEIGSHYTYSLVPWQDWCRDLLGVAPDWERNHYDRLLHFLFGLMITLPIAELVASSLSTRSIATWLWAMCLIITFSSLYELLEWGAAHLSEPEIGIAFVGAQGDPWDAQKDMALAVAGSAVAVLARALWGAATRLSSRHRHS